MNTVRPEDQHPSPAECPFFDSNTHPTLTGRWSEQCVQPTFENLSQEISSSGAAGACAVGLWGVENYSHREFIEECRRFGNLVPIAGFAPSRSPNIKEELSLIKSLGYKGLKIHPRVCRSDLKDHKREYVETLRAAYERELTVFYCTFLSIEVEQFPSYDPFWALVDILKDAPKTKLILVHGGLTRLLLYAELARFNPNILLDLSFTIMKFEGSSLDDDIKFLFRTLDQRLCVGSDYPEYGIDAVKKRVARLGAGLPAAKLRGIYGGNLSRFFDLPPIKTT
jgi:predicted TIM-barrel fold metal-dependent hydrolase